MRTFMLMGAFFILIVRPFNWSSFLFLNYLLFLKAHFHVFLLKQKISCMRATRKILFFVFIKNSRIFAFNAEKKSFFPLFCSSLHPHSFSHSPFFKLMIDDAHLIIFLFSIAISLVVCLRFSEDGVKSLTNNHHHQCIRWGKGKV